MRKKRFLTGLLLWLSLCLCTFFVFQIGVKKAPARLQHTAKAVNEQTISLRYTALGDSLTEGIGDETQSGGFVPLLAKELQNDPTITRVDSQNFGVAGERSDQIIKRLKKDTALQESLAQANFITLTVGGNDLVKVIQDDLQKLSVTRLQKPMKKYEERLVTLLKDIRAYNPHAPIYLVGVYNPFYIYFPEITEMQTIVDNWNETSQLATTQVSQTYFVSVNELLAEGLVGGATATTSEATVVKNNFLYDVDKFHPNHSGYQQMANAIYQEMMETKKDWLQ